MANSDSAAKRRQLGHSRLPRRKTGAASGSSSAPAMAQRSRLSVMGDTSGATTRPTTALPAHITGGRVSKAAALSVSFAVFMNWSLGSADWPRIHRLDWACQTGNLGTACSRVAPERAVVHGSQHLRQSL